MTSECRLAPKFLKKFDCETEEGAKNCCYRGIWSCYQKASQYSTHIVGQFKYDSYAHGTYIPREKSHGDKSKSTEIDTGFWNILPM